MESILGPEGVITEREQLRSYECDGLMNYRVIPELVVLPETAEQVQRIVRTCYDEGIPFVARGSGTGLSGGGSAGRGGDSHRSLQDAQDPRGGHPEPAGRRRARRHKHLVSQEVADDGYYYAPDPASQIVSSIGGNLAENSGGVHCLKYGFTTNHVMGAEIVLPDGTMVNVGGGMAPTPPATSSRRVRRLGGNFGDSDEDHPARRAQARGGEDPARGLQGHEEAGGAVSGIIGAGIVPAAIEMMDSLCIEAVETAVHPGLPPGRGHPDSGARRPGREVEDQFQHTIRVCEENDASEVRIAEDDEERALFWKGRKAAFAAMGRIANDYYVQDSVVPRTELGAVLKRISELGASTGCASPTSSTPATATSTRSCSTTTTCPARPRRPRPSAGDIVFTCLEHGGSLTGEHGIGEDKKKYMPKMFTTEDLDTMQLLRCAFDPHQICNPARSSRPRASAASGRGPSACTPSSRPAWRRTSDGDAHEERLAGGPAEHSRRGARPPRPRNEEPSTASHPPSWSPRLHAKRLASYEFANDQDLAVGPEGGGHHDVLGNPPRESTSS
jgi:glycolate oxidase